MKYNTAYLKCKEESLKGTILREAEKGLQSGKSKSLDKNLSPYKERRAEIRESGNKLLWYKIIALERK